jgi:chitin synthase
MFGMMPGNPSMMMGGGTPSMMMGGVGTPSMMMNAMPGGMGMMGYNGGPGSAGHAQPPMVLTKNLSEEPSEEEIVTTLRIYLSQQDLMKITKRSVRDALNEWFPKFVLLPSLSLSSIIFLSYFCVCFFFFFC